MEGAASTHSPLRGDVEEENHNLKLRLERLERENRLLKRSLYETNASLSALAERLNLDPPVMNLNAALASVDEADGSLGTNLAKLISNTFDAGVSAPAAFSSGAPRYAYQYDLDPHSGSIYALAFCPSGTLLASASFDTSIRIWENVQQRDEPVMLSGHLALVADLAWSSDSSMLLSASFDHTLRFWDVARRKSVAVHTVDGFAQCCAIKGTEERIGYCGTSTKDLYCLDARAPADYSDGGKFASHTSMINCLAYLADSEHLLAGDATGDLVLWDLRAGRAPLRTISVSPSKKPTSWISLCLPPERDVSRQSLSYAAVNCYDNQLRVYDLETLIRDKEPQPFAVCAGHKNKNWPIKSSFRRGEHFGRRARRRYGGIGGGASGKSGTMQEDGEDESPTLEDLVVLATGSTDGDVYLFEIDGGKNPGGLLQELEGHDDRVHAVSFQPSSAWLASGGADARVKLWAPRGGPRV